MRRRASDASMCVMEMAAGAVLLCAATVGAMAGMVGATPPLLVGGAALVLLGIGGLVE